MIQNSVAAMFCWLREQTHSESVKELEAPIHEQGPKNKSSSSICMGIKWKTTNYGGTSRQWLETSGLPSQCLIPIPSEQDWTYVTRLVFFSTTGGR